MFSLVSIFQYAKSLNCEMIRWLGIYSMVVMSLSTICYFGDLITVESLNVKYHVSYNTLCYRLPVRLRVYIKLLILFAQQPIYITGITLLKCSLDSFTSVCLVNLFESFICLWSFVLHF